MISLADELLYLSEHIRINFLVAWVYPQESLMKDCDFDTVREVMYVYRNIFLESVRCDIGINIKENPTFFENLNLE